MHEYDVSLKLLLRGSGGGLLRTLTGVEVVDWLDVEMPAIQNTRVDLLGQAASGELIHIELQSSNDAAMPLRMLEYSARVFRLYQRFPRQIVLYVGKAPLRMEPVLTGPYLDFRYAIADIRTFDGDELLRSQQTGDNVVAILANLSNQEAAVRQILTRVGSLDPAARETAFGLLMMLAGLRSLEEFIEKEAKKMPILDDIMDHKVIGRERKLGMEIGRAEGVHEGERKMLLRQIEKRFGPVPTWAADLLQGKSSSELEELGVRILDAESLAQLLQ